MDSVFFDTNVLVYTVDDDSPEKQKRAQVIVNAGSLHAMPVISTQILQEFYNASTAKLKIDKRRAKIIVQDLRNMRVIQVTPDIIEQGIDISISAQLSFWDGLIIASAEFAGCGTVLSEDLQDGQSIHGVNIVNPFLHRLPWED